ncbi:conserved protein of unknown function (plasmid) [Rhodovastum atsumiense]|uniref:Uncharacterized protein n=1 Tax=Rhodovastum atsumiense TaxID=504468 RepID=A0A5M6IU72_9PROT|nr:hypothetical protein [Rhodovastum atsumiense]KAA5611824.1 hypothetical protein F1189_12360 [Rhodovastum atsumiense]CAH2606065.1 conserved protein of unknown function [Rhodovastum atsumiense]
MGEDTTSADTRQIISAATSALDAAAAATPGTQAAWLAADASTSVFAVLRPVADGTAPMSGDEAAGLRDSIGILRLAAECAEGTVGAHGDDADWGRAAGCCLDVIYVCGRALQALPAA